MEEKIEKEIRKEKEEVEKRKEDIKEKEKAIEKDKEFIKEEEKEIKELEKEEHQKEYKIFINSREKIWDKKEISYHDVVTLAFGSEDPNKVYDITFSRGPESNHEGTLVKGDSVKVKNGMLFNATPTNKS